MRQFNEKDFFLAERAFKRNDVITFNVFKEEAIKRLEYLKPLLNEIDNKGMDLYHICYELNQEVIQLEEIINNKL